jgi:16S rRNA G966 N2-methylase RsmD
LNLTILHIEIQEFINKHLNSDTTSVLLKGVPFTNIDSKELVEQIGSKKRSEKKLPTWFSADTIYYPKKINIEQTSSEITAKYKADLTSGRSLIDLTGGFGVDAFYFSKDIEKITHCEINSELSEIVKHNYKTLKTSNIKCLNENGIEVLNRLDKQFDWIYIDPSRRNDNKRKVFLLSDCEPNIKIFQGLFLKYAKNVMIKTSPLLDVSATLLDLKHVKHIHIVAIKNEVKELIWILERNFESEVLITTSNLKKEKSQYFEFKHKDETNLQANYSEPLDYLYEPNSAILKAGAFNSIAVNLNIDKLHKHSHLYTSKILIKFPGRRFKIQKILPFNKKVFLKESISKANVTVRNFPVSVGEIRKKLNITDGGDTYLFFTTDLNANKIILVCCRA